MESVGVGYSGSIGKASYFINYSYNRNVQSTDDSDNNRPSSDTVVSLTLSIPLGETLSANYTLNHGRHNDRIKAPPATSASTTRARKGM